MDLVLKQRAKIKALCEHNLEFRQRILARCKEDTVFFINTFCYTYDPRLKIKKIPFFLFPKQVELVNFVENAIETRDWVLMDKSRDTGMSVCMTSIFYKHWFFDEGFAGGLGSYKAEYVDKLGDPKSLFEKFRFLLRTLPNWFVPEGWEKNSKSMLLVNPINGSTVTGEAGDNIGRGGRTSFYWVDEWPKVQRSQAVADALSQNSNAGCFLGTPNGTNNEHYRMLISGNFPHFRIHWKDDPRKNQWVILKENDSISLKELYNCLRNETLDPDKYCFGSGWDAPENAIYPWYEMEKLKWSDVTIAQELDIDYTASIEGILIKAVWVRAAIDAHYKIPEIKDNNHDLSAGLDVAAGGSNKSVLWIRKGAYVFPEKYTWDLDPVQVAYQVDSLCKKLGVKHLTFDSDGVGMGTAGTLDMIPDKPYTVKAFRGNSTEDLDRIIIAGEDRTAKDKYKNYRAAYYGELAERFRKTYATIEGIETYPSDELISIPNDTTLITQLSQPTIKYSVGKIVLTEKNLLASSPDEADSLVYAFVESIPVCWWE